jgi:hypothetical protein
MSCQASLKQPASAKARAPTVTRTDEVSATAGRAPAVRGDAVISQMQNRPQPVAYPPSPIADLIRKHRGLIAEIWDKHVRELRNPQQVRAT